MHRHKRRDTMRRWKSERRRAACTGGVHVLPQPVAATRHSGGNSCSSAPNRMFLTHENLLSESLFVTMLVAGRRPQSWVCGVGASWWKNKVFVSSLWMFLRIFVVESCPLRGSSVSGVALNRGVIIASVTSSLRDFHRYIQGNKKIYIYLRFEKMFKTCILKITSILIFKVYQKEIFCKPVWN